MISWRKPSNRRRTYLSLAVHVLHVFMAHEAQSASIALQRLSRNEKQLWGTCTENTIVHLIECSNTYHQDQKWSWWQIAVTLRRRGKPRQWNATHRSILRKHIAVQNSWLTVKQSTSCNSLVMISICDTREYQDLRQLLIMVVSGACTFVWPSKRI